MKKGPTLASRTPHNLKGIVHVADYYRNRKKVCGTAETQQTEETVKQIRLLWRHIFGGQSGRLMVWTGERDEAGDIPHDTVRSKVFNYPKADKAAAEWALGKSSEGREVFFCAHLLTAAQRSKEYAAPVRSLWADLDGAPIPNGELAPTAVVVSSPGRYHVYWRLTGEIPPETAESFNKRIALQIGADPSGVDLSQVLRVPGTANWKYEAQPTVELRDLDGERECSPADLERLLPKIEDPGREKGPEGTKADADEPPVELGPEALKVWRGENPKLKEEDDGEIDTSATLLKIGRAVYDAGANRRVVIEALRERDNTLGYRKYVGRRDGGQREYERIFERLKGEGRNIRVPLFGGSETPAHKPEWPEIAKAAYEGIFGDIVKLVEPHTEGDPVAVLTNALVDVGNAMGRGPYVQIGATRHRTNLFAGQVGATAKGRKGSASKPVENIMHASDQRWAEDRIVSGLSSGEGLIDNVRDPIQVPDKEGGMKVVDPGVKDKRLLVMEGELSQALKVMKREGNTLSPVMRNAWDGETLRTLVRHSPLKATDPHISVIGHITIAELNRYLTETEMANGLANRFLWLLVRRSKKLPFGGEWHTADLTPITKKLAGIIQYADHDVRMTWGEDARPLWEEAYEALTEDRPGMFGAITARAEAQTLRLAMIYALADCSREISRSHVESALAVWKYAEASARYIFGDATGDPDADKVLAALKDAEDGLTRTQVSKELFGGNKSSKELDRIREALIKAGRLRVSHKAEAGSKKPIERWTVARKTNSLNS